MSTAHAATWFATQSFAVSERPASYICMSRKDGGSYTVLVTSSEAAELFRREQESYGCTVEIREAR